MIASKKDLIIIQFKIKNVKKREDNINTNFIDNGLPKEGSHCTCLSVITNDSVFKMGKSYYPPAILKESKYIVKEKKINRYIHSDLEVSSGNSYKEDSNKGISNEEDNYIGE